MDSIVFLHTNDVPGISVVFFHTFANLTNPETWIVGALEFSDHVINHVHFTGANSRARACPRDFVESIVLTVACNYVYPLGPLRNNFGPYSDDSISV